MAAGQKNEDVAGQVSDGPQIIRDDSNIRSAFANVVEVVGSREEIMLLFGEAAAGHAGSDETRVKLKERIVLNPRAAKRLAILLHRGIRQYESEYGSLEGRASLPAEPHQMPFPHVTSPFSRAAGRHDQAGLLIQLVENLKVGYVISRSFKILEKTMLANRFLLTIAKNDIRQKPNMSILDICERTNMPADLLEASEHYLGDANYVHFGFEEGESACIYRMYLEFWTTWENEIDKRPGRSDPFLFGVGLKWDALDNANRALTNYTWYPSISLENMRKRVSSIYEGPEYEKPLKIASDILDVALHSTSHDRFLYIEAADENSPRRSFDINIYKARVLLGELYPLLLTMCEHYSIDSEVFHTLYDPVRNELFGHIQGGIDKKERDFITIYYGLEGR
jgi:hypothetical protein